MCIGTIIYAYYKYLRPKYSLSIIKVYPKYKTYECPICLCEFNDSIIVRTQCNHYYHKDCLYEWLTRQSICPTCRTIIL